jgi:ankyrin repeat protein
MHTFTSPFARFYSGIRLRYFFSKQILDPASSLKEFELILRQTQAFPSILNSNQDSFMVFIDRFFEATNRPGITFELIVKISLLISEQQLPQEINDAITDKLISKNLVQVQNVPRQNEPRTVDILDEKHIIKMLMALSHPSRHQIEEYQNKILEYLHKITPNPEIVYVDAEAKSMQLLRTRIEFYSLIFQYQSINPQILTQAISAIFKENDLSEDFLIYLMEQIESQKSVSVVLQMEAKKILRCQNASASDFYLKLLQIQHVDYEESVAKFFDRIERGNDPNFDNIKKILVCTFCTTQLSELPKESPYIRKLSESQKESLAKICARKLSESQKEFLAKLFFDQAWEGIKGAYRNSESCAHGLFLRCLYIYSQLENLVDSPANAEESIKNIILERIHSCSQNTIYFFERFLSLEQISKIANLPIKIQRLAISQALYAIMQESLWIYPIQFKNIEYSKCKTVLDDLLLDDSFVLEMIKNLQDVIVILECADVSQIHHFIPKYPRAVEQVLLQDLSESELTQEQLQQYLQKSLEVKDFYSTVAILKYATKMNVPIYISRELKELFKVINALDANSENILMKCMKNNLCIRHVIALTENILAEDQNGASIFMIAAQTGNIDVIRSLMKDWYMYKILYEIKIFTCILREYRKVFPKTENYVSFTRREMQVKDFKKILKFFIESGVDFDAVDVHRKTILMYAVEGNYWRLVKMLIEVSNVNPNIQDKNGETALMKSVKMPRNTTLEFLLKIPNTEFNLQDKDGNTALMHAVKSSHKLGIEWLLTKNPDFEIKNNEGLRVLDLAERFCDDASLINSIKLLMDQNQERNSRVCKVMTCFLRSHESFSL